jgi:hypothetical protein
VARVQHWVPTLWALVLGTLMLGPALLPGYVLTYDMVWVPDLGLRTDFLGVGSAVPRAVPSDAVVAVLDEVIPGMLLQKLVLLGSLVAAGAGAAALVAPLPVIARLGAVTFYVWNPLVVERLVMGHWPLLLTYAVVPWLWIALRRWRGGTSGRGWWLLVLVGSLSASGGVLTAVVVLLGGAGRHSWRRWAELLGVLVAANAPWLLAGLLHAEQARVDSRSVEVFGLSGEGLLPAPLAALSLGGIWNADVVPDSRTGPAAVVGLVVLLAMCATGLVRWTAVPDRWRLASLWAVGSLAALLTWLVPEDLGAVAASVPGAGLMRDGGRMLVLCAPLVATLLAQGITSLYGVFAARWQGGMVAACVGLAPLAVMPDAAFGASGRLAAVDFPDAYEQARAAVGADGDVLVLPFSSYRAFAWNGNRPSLDPLGRYLRPNYVANDQLVVDGSPLRGEDPRARAVAGALSGPAPESALAELGIGTVVQDGFATGEGTDIRGPVLLSGKVRVVGVRGASPEPPPRAWWVAMAGAWSLFVLLLAGGAWSVSRTVSARNGRFRDSD